MVAQDLNRAEDQSTDAASEAHDSVRSIADGRDAVERALNAGAIVAAEVTDPRDYPRQILFGDLALDDVTNEKLAALYGMLFRQTHFFMGFIPGIKAFTAAVLGGIAFAFLGLPAALLWGTLMALLSLLPAVGAAAPPPPRGRPQRPIGASAGLAPRRA